MHVAMLTCTLASTVTRYVHIPTLMSECKSTLWIVYGLSAYTVPLHTVCMSALSHVMWKASTGAISLYLPVVKAVSDINKTVVEGTPEELLVALKTPVAGIRSITDECAVTYQEKLKGAREDKARKCECSPTSSQRYL